MQSLDCIPVAGTFASMGERTGTPLFTRRHRGFFLFLWKIMNNMHTGSKNDHFFLFIRNNGCQKRVLKKNLKPYISKYF